MMKTRTIPVTLVAFALMGWLSATAVSAQVTPQNPPTNASEVEVSEQEMDAVASAYISVQTLLTTYQTQLDAVQDPERAKEVQQQFAQEANEAIEAEGLAVERYDEVVRAANEHEPLRERLVQHIDQIMAEQGGVPEPDQR